MKKVYLAGPIAGLTIGESSLWRDYVIDEFSDFTGVECLTPLRGKYFLGVDNIIGPYEYDNPLTTAKGITRRDMFDVLSSDAVLVNLLGSQKVSIGTCIEIGWTYRDQIPCVVVMEPDNVHKHVFIQESATYIVHTLNEGINLIKLLLNLKG